MVKERRPGRKIILDTERLVLREFEERDAQNLFDLNADSDVIRYTGDPPFSSVLDARKFIRNYDQYERYGYGRWAVLLKPEEKFIGWCGLKMNEIHEVDIGYRFFKKFWNLGFATEAATACLKYGFEHLQLGSIIGRSAKENHASIRVLEKIGLRYWKDDTCKGMENSLYYRITLKEYLDRSRHGLTGK
jgi:RimJ/RimL family protein N-acetyltransferase